MHFVSLAAVLLSAVFVDMAPNYFNSELRLMEDQVVPYVEEKISTNGFIDFPVDLVDDKAHARQSSCNCRSSRSFEESRIINGTEVSPQNRFPWVVLMRHSSFCGSFMISETKVVSAAHCVVEDDSTTAVRSLELYFGCHLNTAQGRQSCTKRDVSQRNIRVHPQYDPDNSYNNDIAVLIVAAVACSSRIRPICQPSANFSPYGRTATVAGWGSTDGYGRTYPRELRTTNLPIAQLSECRRYERNFNQQTKICTISPNTTDCSGDSGSSLFLNDGGVMTVVGLVSYGPMPCQTYSVYARYQNYLDWIARNN